MKKTPILILAFLFTFSPTCISIMNFESIKRFISSGFESIENRLDKVAKENDSADESEKNHEKNTDFSSNTKKDEITSTEEKPLDTSNSFSKYFPSTKEMSIFSVGDYKYGSSIDTIQYISNNKIQILTVCGSRIQKVYKFTKEGVYIINETELNDSDPPSNIIDTPSSYEFLLIKGPLALKTKWTNNIGDSFEITGIDKTCTTKAGEFKSIEITKTQNSTGNITREYYGEGVGLVKSVTRDSKDNIISLRQAEKVEK